MSAQDRSMASWRVGRLPLRLLACLALGSLPGAAAEFVCPPAFYKRHADLVPLAGGKVNIPMFRYHPGNDDDIVLAIVVLHAPGGPSDNYFGWIVNSELANHQKSNTVVVMPVFPDNSPCNASAWVRDENVTGETVRWSGDWTYGQIGDTVAGVPGISSFAAIDQVIQWLELEYPNLKRIDVAGHSRGADLGLLWAVTSPNGYKNKTSGGVLMRVLLGSPNTYVYLNDRRPAKTCAPLPSSEVAAVECEDFLIPGTTPDAADPCTDYNRFPNGLDGINSASDEDGPANAVKSYLKGYMDTSVARATLPAHFATKEVLFMVSKDSTKACEGDGCPSSCQAALQGIGALQQAENYVGHLKDALPGYEPRLYTFEGPADPARFFKTSVWSEAAFGDIPGDPLRKYPWDIQVSSGLGTLVACCVTVAFCAGLLGLVLGNQSRSRERDPMEEGYEDFEVKESDEEAMPTGSYSDQSDTEP